MVYVFRSFLQPQRTSGKFSSKTESNVLKQLQWSSESFAGGGIGCLLWPSLGEHLGQYITIIKFQGGQEAESGKNWNLMLTSFLGHFAILATRRAAKGLESTCMHYFILILSRGRALCVKIQQQRKKKKHSSQSKHIPASRVT